MSENQNPIRKALDTEVESPNFDISFQMSVLHLALTDDYFCGQLVKYLGQDKDLDEYSIFDSRELQEIFKLMTQSIEAFRQRPTEGQIRQELMKFEEQRKTELNLALDAVLQTDIHNDAYYRSHLQTYIQQVKFAKGYKKTRNIFSKKGIKSAPEFMQSVIDGVRRVSFDQEDIVSMDDLPTLITEGIESNTRKIPTGIKDLDEDLVGGLPRENLTVVLAGTNVGKSLFCISLAANALRSRAPDGSDLGFKVLHINLEGMRDEGLKRYAANLAQINYGDLIRGSYNDEAKQRLDDIQMKYGPHRLMIRNMLGFGATVEALIGFCRETYKEFKFDMLVVDYGQLLETEAKTEGHRFVMSKVFRGLDSLSKEFKCVVITPAQATRGAQTKQNEGNARFGKQEDRSPILRSEDISEAFEIARVSGVILTLNVTEEESKKGRLRLFLEKQRQGAKNKLYGLITNYSQANLITGKTYDPFETMIEGDMSMNKTEDVIKKRAAQPGLTGTVKPQNLPKPKPLAGADPVDAEKVGDGTSYTPVEEAPMSDMERTLDTLSNEFLQLKDEYMRIKTAYDNLREDDTPDEAELDKLFNQCQQLKDALSERQIEIRTMLPQVYDTANRETLDLMKNSLNDMKRSGSTSRDLPKIERMVKHLEIGLDLVKIPT